MPNKRIPMPRLIDILRLKHEAGFSHEKIGCVVGLSKGAVGKYVNLAKAVGIAWPLPPGMDEAQLESLLFRGQDKPASKFAQPDFPLIHQELKRKGGPCSCCGRSMRRHTAPTPIATASSVVTSA